eukprot:jgi/Tetstr1/458203/TSEL_044692.t1
MRAAAQGVVPRQASRTQLPQRSRAVALVAARTEHVTARLRSVVQRTPTWQARERPAEAVGSREEEAQQGTAWPFEDAGGLQQGLVEQGGAESLRAEGVEEVSQAPRRGRGRGQGRAKRGRVRAELKADMPTRTTITWSNTIALFRVAERTHSARTEAERRQRLSEIQRRMRLAGQVKRPRRPSGAELAELRRKRRAGPAPLAAPATPEAGAAKVAGQGKGKKARKTYMSRREEGELVQRYQRWQRVQNIRARMVLELGCEATPEMMVQWLELPGGVRSLAQIDALGHEALETMRAKHLNLIRQAAWRHCGEGMAVDALVAEGQGVLEKALRSFDPHRSVSFATYLLSMAHNAMSDASAAYTRCATVPRRVLHQQRKIRRAVQELEKSAPHRASDPAAVAALSSLSVPDVVDYLEGAGRVSEVSAEAKAAELLLHEKARAPPVPDPTTHSRRASQLFTYGVGHTVRVALLRLEPRERFVVEQVFGLSRCGLRRSMAQLAEEMLLTAAGVRHIRNTALAKLRATPEMAELCHLVFPRGAPPGGGEQSARPAAAGRGPPRLGRPPRALLAAVQTAPKPWEAGS